MGITIYLIGAVASGLLWVFVLNKELVTFSRVDKAALLSMIVLWPATWLAIGVMELMNWLSVRRSR